MKVAGEIHQFGHIDVAGETFFQSDIFGTDTQNDILRLKVGLSLSSLLF